MGGIWKPAGRKKYRLWFKDHAGQRRTAPGYKDKQASLAKLASLERDEERQEAGLPALNRKPQLLEDLIARHIADLRRQGAGEEHVRHRQGFLTRLAGWENWTHLHHVQHGQMVDALARLAGLGRANQTVEAYRTNWKAFLGWCLDGKLLEVNPVARVKAVKKIKAARPRRAPTIEEWQQLLDTSKARRPLYTVAALTGLRKSECARLERRDVDLDAQQLKLRAEATKSGRADIVPLLPDVAPTLTALCDGLEPHQLLFSRFPCRRTIRDDIKRAGIASPDQSGRLVTFHSLRYFFCTLLARSLPIQIVRLMMRHRDISVTCKIYLDLGLQDVAEEVLKLPSVLKRPLAHPEE